MSIKKEFEEKSGEFKKDIAETKDKMSKSIDSGMKKTKSFFKKILWSALLILIVGIIGFFLYANYTYSEGTRAGDLIKISRKGYIFKTHEGQLKLGGIDLQNPDEGLSDTWSFSVTDHAVVDQLEKMQGKKVVLKYCEKNYALPWQGDTKYFITEVNEQE